MNADNLFRVANTIALLGWLMLIVSGKLRGVSTLITAVLIPGLLAIFYVYLLMTHLGSSNGSFNTLGGVAALFANRYLLLAGWIHYLAFDLFVGSWEVRDAIANRIPHLAVIPVLVLTFLFGPLGYLSYLLLRFAVKKKLPIA